MSCQVSLTEYWIYQLANNCMVNSTADLNKATVDIEKILIESTRDIVVPDSVTSCLWIGDRTNRNLSDFNIQYSSPSSLELVDLISTVRRNADILYDEEHTVIQPHKFSSRSISALDLHLVLKLKQ